LSESKTGPGFVGGVIQKRMTGGPDGKPGKWDEDGATPPAKVTEASTRDESWDRYRQFVG